MRSNLLTRFGAARSRDFATLRRAISRRRQPGKATRTATRIPVSTPQSRLFTALRLEQPHGLLFPLLSVTKDPEFIAALPNTAILQILRLLDPNFFLKHYRSLYQYIAPNIINRLDRVSRIDQLVIKFKSAYVFIVQGLVGHRKNLVFQKYEALLKLAQATGDGPLGALIWKDMLMDQVEPDIVLYNLYFEALCPPMSLIPKRPEQHPSDSYGLDAVEHKKLSEPDAVYRRVSRKLAQMIDKGVMADTKTFTLLMLASARADDMRTVKTILKNVWHIDVDGIIATNKTLESLDVQPKSALHPPNSALHPTPDLLFAIANIFGSDHNIAVAMRLVHHVSHRFSVPIDDRVWLELVSQTYINIRRSTRRPAWLVPHPPKVPVQSLEALWNIERFEIMEDIEDLSPSMPMLQRPMVRMYLYRRRYTAMLKAMVIFLLHFKRCDSKFIDRLEKSAMGLEAIRSPETLESFNSSILPTHLEMIRHLYEIGLWVGLLLDMRANLRWQRIVIPKIIDLFWPYRDPYWGLDFRMMTGRVRLRRLSLDPVACQEFDVNSYLGRESMPS